MTTPTPWMPASYEVLRIAMAAFLARQRGDKAHAAYLIADAGRRGLSFEVLDATWWMLSRQGGYSDDPAKQDELNQDILRLAGWEDEDPEAESE